MTKLTDKEQSLIGTRVVAITDIEYGTCFIPKGVIPKDSKGTIVNYGIASGDPVIKWDFTDCKTIAELDKHILLLGDVSKYTTVK